MPLSVAYSRKFNPYHDPANGQFTTGPGGGTGQDAPGSIKPPTSMRAAATAPKPAPPPAPQGPFTTHAQDKGADGEVARGLNRLAATPDSTTQITFAGLSMSVTRDNSNGIILQSSTVLGTLTGSGTLSVTPGKQEMIFSNLTLSLHSMTSSLVSAPSRLRFYANNSRELLVQFDKPLFVKTPALIKDIHREAASYYVSEQPKKPK